MEFSTGELGTRFVVVTEEIQSHRTTQQIGVGLSPFSNNGDQVLSGILFWAINVEHLIV